MPLPTFTDGQALPAADLNAIVTAADRVTTRAIDVRDHGAVGGGLGTTIGSGNIAAIRTASGQAWLEATDTLDLAGFYLAQVEAESTGRGILFPRDDYVFTAPAFLHAGIKVDLGGSTVTNTAADATRFARGNRAFVLGIMAREDFDRYDSNGWTHTAANIALDAKQLTTFSGTMPSVGDTLLIRTTATSGSSPTMPLYTTYNRVASVVGTTVGLVFPVEKAITAPIIVNYSTITTLKSALVGTGEPHRYFCSDQSSLTNGTLVSTSGTALEVNAALDFDLDVRCESVHGQGVYGNGWNRGRVRVTGIVGGPKAPVELAVGSALSTIDVDLAYSGDDTDTTGAVSGSYPIIQLGEYIERNTVTGKVRAANKPATLGITFPTSSNNTVTADTVQRGNTTYAVTFPSNAGSGNRVRGKHEISIAATHYAYFAAGTGLDNWIEAATFIGDQSGTTSVRFLGSNLGGVKGSTLPEGKLTFDTGVTGNVVIDSYVREGVSSAGSFGNRVRIQTELGSYPEDDVIIATNLTGTILVSETTGRTVTNTGATAIRTRTLPVSVAGMVARFYRNNASFALRIDPNGTEVIGANAAGKYIELADKGYVELRCYTAGAWVIAASSGTITVEP